MDHAAEKAIASLSPRRRKQLSLAGFALLAVCLLGAGLAVGVRQSRVRHQRQSDPEVATVWLLQVTHGPNHSLVRGSVVQRWANAHGVHTLGDYQVLNGSFNGEPNGIEFWFDYDSHTAVKDLECHRVGPTAFVDDLGQTYHGFLDFQGKIVGVYLPGYDHAAHRIDCVVHWMPRRPSAPLPVSRPMTFSVPLTPVSRKLPPVATLPSGPVSVTKNGISVTVSDVHLSSAQLRTLYAGQRDLKFRLQIQGGQIVDDNVQQPITSENFSIAFSGETVIQRRIYSVQGSPPYTYVVRTGRNGSTGGPASADSFTITDPYGIALLPDTASVAMPTKPRKGQPSTPYWVAPVNGAGRGTDCVLFHLHVQPPAASPKAMPPESVAFDIPVRVSSAATP